MCIASHPTSLSLLPHSLSLPRSLPLSHPLSYLTLSLYRRFARRGNTCVMPPTLPHSLSHVSLSLYLTLSLYPTHSRTSLSLFTAVLLDEVTHVYCLSPHLSLSLTSLQLALSLYFTHSLTSLSLFTAVLFDEVTHVYCLSLHPTHSLLQLTLSLYPTHSLTTLLFFTPLTLFPHSLSLLPFCSMKYTCVLPLTPPHSLSYISLSLFTLLILLPHCRSLPHSLSYLSFSLHRRFAR